MAEDYKTTLNLPRTDFPMKANLTQKEPFTLRFWEESALYDRIQEKNKNAAPISFTTVRHMQMATFTSDMP